MLLRHTVQVTHLNGGGYSSSSLCFQRFWHGSLEAVMYKFWLIQAGIVSILNECVPLAMPNLYCCTIKVHYNRITINGNPLKVYHLWSFSPISLDVCSLGCKKYLSESSIYLKRYESFCLSLNRSSALILILTFTFKSEFIRLSSVNGSGCAYRGNSLEYWHFVQVFVYSWQR